MTNFNWKVRIAREVVEDYKSSAHNLLSTGLKVLRDVQFHASGLVDGAIPYENLPASSDQIRTYFLSLFVELGELLQELDWKPWKHKAEINKHRVVDEFADILAFLGIIILYLERMGISTDDLQKAYFDKSTVNINRFNGEVEGYGKK